MTQRVKAVLERRAKPGFVGRRHELASLCEVLDPAGPLVVHISGVAGIGKSRLVEAFEDQAREAGAKVIHLDARRMEPSILGFLAACADGAGLPAPSTAEELAEGLTGVEGTMVVVIDNYELAWLIDAYLRREFCPLLDDSVRLVFAARSEPVTAWVADPTWQGQFREIPLGPLTEREAIEYLKERGLSESSARNVNAICHGHPLALTLAANLSASSGGKRAANEAAAAAVDRLAAEYLAEVTEPEVREAIEAVSVIRRGTRTLFSALLPGARPEVFNRLRQLPFVESGSDGVFLHAAVRDAVATSLEASDPARYRAYRIAAWRQLRDEVREVSPALLWRYTADILYLLQNPVVREGFFPSGYQPLGVEQARPEDGDAICEIAYAQEPADSARLLEAWWSARPGVFSVCRDYDGSVSGFLIAGRGWDVPREVVAVDPVTAAWAEDIARTGMGKGTLLLRRLLDRYDGEGNSRSRGPLGVDVKRTYMELRPQLRYVYLCGVEWENMNWCDPLGFRGLPGADRDIGGTTYRSYRLDMGPGSVDAWLARLVAAELGIADEATQGRSLLDTEAHEIVLPEGRVALTPLEFGVMRELELRAGRPVSRADLVERVWGYESAATSNVVDTVILALRRKLGDRASMIETVRSVGYRYRQ